MLNYHKSWRLINSKECSASFNMALDEAISAFVRKGASLPTLRLYSWDKPSVTIGCFQRVRDVNLEFCNNSGIDVVRRPTGGRALLHDKELTYSFSIRNDHEAFSAGLLDSYKKISAAFNLAFKKIGLDVETKTRRESGSVLVKSPLCFQSRSFGELGLNGKKIVGSAQKRWPDGLLQQGSIPYYIDDIMIMKIFRLRANGKLDFAGIKHFIPELSDERFRETVKTSFEETFGISFIDELPSPEENTLAMKLKAEKYQTAEWNLRQ